jgi:hypothetical protein
LKPYPVPLTAYDSTSYRLHVIVSGNKPITRLRIELGIVFARTMRYPTLDYQITANAVGIKP